jgi:DNA-binding transcriptional ArsR family regulator
MTDIYMLKRLEQVKAIADPLRLRILNLLCQEALTTKQVGERLGEQVNKLYHHVEALESAELIQLVETRPNRGTLEKYFRAVARHFTLSPQLFEVRLDADAAITENTFSSALQATLAEVKQSLDQKLIPNSGKFFTRFHIRTTPARAEELRQQFQTWVDECRAAEKNLPANSPTQEFALTATFYPVAHKTEPLLQPDKA